jgi:hypothetical protein
VRQYFNRAVSGLENIKKYCRPGVGVAGIEDVRNTTSEWINHTESFFFAEVIKYIYLTFADPNNIHLDKYVVCFELYLASVCEHIYDNHLSSTQRHIPSKFLPHFCHTSHRSRQNWVVNSHHRLGPVQFLRLVKLLGYTKSCLILSSRDSLCK